MRLIDADKITDKEINQYLGVEHASCAEDIRILIDDQPTVLNRESHGVLHKIAKYLTEEYEGDDDNAPTLDITIGDMREICGMRQDLFGARKLLEQGQLYGRWWIPVTERLPEDGDCRYYMCTLENHSGDVPALVQFEEERGFGFYKDIYDPVSFGFVDTEFNTMEELEYEEVVAWMPLPEPYREV